jgi:peptide/nickel transport system permease protein
MTRGLLPVLALRLVQSAIVVFAVTTVVFFVARVAGDPISYLAPLTATNEEIERIKDSYGLNDPWYEQYGRFLADTARLDMGKSFRTGQPALAEVRSRVGNTLKLGVAALVFSLLLAIPLGVLSAITRGSPLDLFARLLALLGQATPSFWLGLMLIFVFSVQLGWLPTGGTGGPEHLILPAVTLGAVTAAATMRLTRSGMLDVLGTDFIRTARAKGLHERTVILRHALRHALLPVVTLLGLQVGRLIAGAVVVETVFGWPGVGRLVISSIQSRDYPVVQCAVILIAGSIVLVNVLVDLSYRLIDPRIQQKAA